MTLLSLKEIVGSEDYYIDDTTFQIVSFKQKKYTEGRIITPIINNNGYVIYRFNVNGKRKHMLLHHIIVKLFINPDFDSKVEEVDHNKNNNTIENLCVVSKSENCRNKSSIKGNKFNFLDNIGQSLIINKEAGIYYSLDLDKFFMFIEHTNKYKELHEVSCSSYPYITYSYNNKSHNFYTTKFRKNLNKK